MARKRSNTKTTARRGDLSTARRQTQKPRLHSYPKPPPPIIQDGRFYSPLKKELRPLLDVQGLPAQIKAIPLLKKYSPTALFKADRRSLLCARRKIRKEVIFAKGRGGRKNSKPRFNHNSKIGC